MDSTWMVYSYAPWSILGIGFFLVPIRHCSIGAEMNLLISWNSGGKLEPISIAIPAKSHFFVLQKEDGTPKGSILKTI
jgi:hypothetical protein